MCEPKVTTTQPKNTQITRYANVSFKSMKNHQEITILRLNFKTVFHSDFNQNFVGDVHDYDQPGDCQAKQC